MNKILPILALSTILFSATGCKNNSSNNSKKSENTTELPMVDYQETEEYSNYPKGDSAADISLSVDFNKENASDFEISPWIYGSSFENLGTTTYGGLYAEIIMDRKFYFNVGAERSPWLLVGGSISANTTSPFEGERSIILKKGSAIKQTQIPLDNETEYVGYVWAKGNGTLTIEYATSGSSNKLSTQIKVDSSNDYKKYEYSFACNKKSKVYILTVTANEGDITVDSFSLLPKNNYYGMRLDTLAHLKAMKVPYLRWPGGDYVSGYDFYNGIGERDKRPTKENIAWSYRATFTQRDFYYIYDPNDFGLEEFLMLCKYLDCEPNVVINAGLGTSTMAAHEVQFCNGDYSTVYGAKRLLSKAPYNVKIWSVGNEMYGSHELGYCDVDTFATRTKNFVEKMKQQDSTIKIIGCGQNFSSWSSTLISKAGNYMDYISQHFYADRYEDDVKRHILSMYNSNAEASIRTHRAIKGSENIPLSFDEYGYAAVNCSSRLKDGMGVAATLNTFIKNGDIVKMACFSETVNSTQGTVMTDDFGAYTEANGYVLSMYSRLMQNRYIKISYKSSAQDYYLVAGTINDKKDTLTISVINTTEKSMKLTSTSFKDVKSIEFLTGDGYNSYNASGKEMLHKYKAELSGKSVFIQPKCIALITIGV